MVRYIVEVEDMANVELLQRFADPTAVLKEVLEGAIAEVRRAAAAAAAPFPEPVVEGTVVVSIDAV